MRPNVFRIGANVYPLDLRGKTTLVRGHLSGQRLDRLGSATNGQIHITARTQPGLAQPSPGHKVLVVTCQQKNGWKAQNHVTSAIVPSQPLPGEQRGNGETKAESVTAAAAPVPQVAPAKVNSPLFRAMYKGSTPDARGMHTGLARVHPLSILCASLVHGLRVGMARLGLLEMVGAEA